MMVVRLTIEDAQRAPILAMKGGLLGAHKCGPRGLKILFRHGRGAAAELSFEAGSAEAARRIQRKLNRTMGRKV